MTIIRTILMILAINLPSCLKLEIDTAPQMNDIPESITGVDSDLWETFVELTNLPDCQFPCLWGLAIGETTLEETLDFLEETDFGRAQTRSIYAEIPETVYLINSIYGLVFTERTSLDTLEIGDVDYTFSFDDEDILAGIGVKMRNPYRWLPEDDNPLLISTLLSEIEEEPIVLVNYSATTRIDDFDLFFFFPENQLRVKYQLDLFEVTPLICINSSTLKSISFSVNDIESRFLGASETRIPIEGSWLVQGSSISTEEFVQFFRDNPGSCLDLSQYP